MIKQNLREDKEKEYDEFSEEIMSNKLKNGESTLKEDPPERNLNHLEKNIELKTKHNTK
jgi:hypothetical protein